VRYELVFKTEGYSFVFKGLIQYCSFRRILTDAERRKCTYQKTLTRIDEKVLIQFAGQFLMLHHHLCKALL